MKTSGTGSTCDTPPFDKAVERLRQFIKSHGGSTKLFWVFREDVSSGTKTWVRFPVPAENFQLASEIYEFGRHQGVGVTLAAYCLVGGEFACFVWVPKDESEAADRLQAPCLKLCIHSGRTEDFRTVQPVTSRLLWRYRCWRNRRWQECLDDCVPSRLDAAERVAVSLNQ